MRYICYSSYQHGEMKTIAHFCSRKGDGRCQWALIAPVRTLFVTTSTLSSLPCAGPRATKALKEANAPTKKLSILRRGCPAPPRSFPRSSGVAFPPVRQACDTTSKRTSKPSRRLAARPLHAGNVWQTSRITPLEALCGHDQAAPPPSRGGAGRCD